MPVNEQTIYTVILLVVMAIAAGLVVYFTSRDGSARAPKAKGGVGADEKAGAAQVVGQLRRYARLNNFQLVAPACWAREGKLAQFDGVLVGYFGVLAVRCLGYGGQVFGGEKEPVWVQTKGEQRFEFENPLDRNARDARVLREVLIAAGLRNIPVETALVCTGGKGQELALPRSTPYYTPKTLGRYLNTSRFDQDKKVDVEKTAQALRDALAQVEQK